MWNCRDGRGCGGREAYAQGRQDKRKGLEGASVLEKAEAVLMARASRTEQDGGELGDAFRVISSCAPKNPAGRQSLSASSYSSGLT